MNEEIRHITNEGKWPKMTGKMLTPTFLSFIQCIQKNNDNSFSILYLLTSLNIDTSSCYKLQIFYQVSEKGEYALQTIAHLTIFMHAFCYICVENFLKGPGNHRETTLNHLKQAML